ncbi:MAG: VIT1/CCC1 transporter family protein [Elusimicrobia bacterium]|jgi:VIT1/CCC1 family predicted Fe2+/Mn2+ transporter|nr:VIT1/CCC1 transporter family protein [Elusimicrobiota bacterium]
MTHLILDTAARARGEELVLDELFDLRLYERLRGVSRGGLSEMLDRLVAVEAKHYAFWQDFFSIRRSDLDWGRRLKLSLVTVICRMVGPSAILLVLEGIEVYGIRKYLTLWDTYRDTPFGQALKDTLMDEFQHEDEIVSGFSGRKINPERVRGIFLGFNDGLVEILGAVSGFFAALRDPPLVLAASVAVAVAGALSMAAGAYAATSSEREIERVQKGKALFLGQKDYENTPGSPVSTGVLVGISYFIGASLPVLPVLFGARNALFSVAAGALATVVVSSVLAFLSGMDVRRRIALNLGVIALAVTITTLIGVVVHRLWGVSL